MPRTDGSGPRGSGPPKKSKFKCIQLFIEMQGNDDVEFEPSDYMKASGEILAFTVLQAWTICFIFKPEQFKDNKLKGLFGYNNPCVAWDVPPALYPSAMLFTLVLYCTIRFAITDTRRAALVGGKDWTFYLTLVLNWIYVLSTMIASLIFVVTPDVDVVAHTGLFICLMQGRWLSVAGQFVEAYVRPQCRIKTSEWIYFFVYSATTLTSCTFAIITLSAGHQVIPTGLMFTADFGWFACLPLTSVFFPDQGGKLRSQFSIVRSDRRTS